MATAEELHDGSGEKIQQVETQQSVGAITLSAELFEKLYLTPKTRQGEDLRKRFANPTPLGFMGFSISAATFGMILMGWGGAQSLTSVVGIFFFTGPVLLILTTIAEWILGNFLPMMVCGMFSVFWLSFGCLQMPTWNIAASYSTTGTNAAEGAASVQYNAAIALYLIVWGFALTTFFVFTLRTNCVFAAIFLLVSIGAFLLSAAYWKVATHDYGTALHLQQAGAAMVFVCAILGWYMTVVMMAAELRITVNLPVGDLSHYWPRSDVELAQLENQH